MTVAREIAFKVADNVPAILVYLDKDLKVLFANRHCYDLLGYAPREILGRSLADMFDAGTLDYALGQAAGLSRGDEAAFDFVLRHKNGEPRYLKVRAVADRDAEGRHVGYIACSSDGSAERALLRAQREETERQLRDARTLLDALLDRLSCPIFATDQLGRIMMLNAGAQRLLALPRGEVVGKMFIDDFNLDPAQLSLVALPGDAGYLVIGCDAAQDLRVSRMRQEAVARAGHELRTPLASVIAALELLREGVGGRLDVSAEAILGLAMQNADRLARRVEKLLEMEGTRSDPMPPPV